jgi:hypothetical protein
MKSMTIRFQDDVINDMPALGPIAERQQINKSTKYQIKAAEMHIYSAILKTKIVAFVSGTPCNIPKGVSVRNFGISNSNYYS